MFARHEMACNERGGCKASARCIVSDFDVRKYLQELRKTLPYVPPIFTEDLKYLHETQDHKGMVRLIKRAMNIADVTVEVFWVPPGAANNGEHRDSPAWIELPSEMPTYGTKSFKELTIKMFFRKEFFEQAYDQAAVTVAHEFSHVVLESTRSPLQNCERAVDLTAMLLGFSRLYEAACYKEQRFGNTIKIKQIGYLCREEVQLVNQILPHPQQRSKIEVVSAMRALMAPVASRPIRAILFLIVGVCALLGLEELYRTSHSHQILVHQTIPAQRIVDLATSASNRGDYATALPLLRLLADQGNTSAQYDLGLMYDNGQGLPQDYAEAVKWYGLAAGQGDAKAQFNLGLMYAEGQGVSQNYVYAHMWLNLSAARGNRDAG